jgi:hypothetical protein
MTGVFDGSADRGDLHPLVVVHVADRQVHADDPIGAEFVGLRLHSLQGELAGVVHQLAVLLHLALDDAALEGAEEVPRQAHRIDAVAQDQPERLVSLVDHEPELLTAQVRRERFSRHAAHGFAGLLRERMVARATENRLWVRHVSPPGRCTRLWWFFATRGRAATYRTCGV